MERNDAKEMVNSFYGLTVQRLRFVSPQWGIWITIHARHRIDNSKLGSRVAYYDTDSIYVVGCKDH